jgi:glutamyl-Q tRNA(Asp) synthetase
LVYADDGQKLSKQTGARALVLDDPARALAALREAARTLGLPASLHEGTASGDAPIAGWLDAAVRAWRDRPFAMA